MSILTKYLKLIKRDVVDDYDSDFDIDLTLNGNWDKIDANAKETTTKIIELEENISNYANAVKQRVDLVKQVQINSSGTCLQDVKVFGESVQEGEPSVNNPVTLTNISNINYKTTGKNILDLDKITLSANTILSNTGVTIENLWGTPILSNQKVLEMFKANTKYICTAKVKVVNKPTILSSSYNHNRILLLNKSSGTNIEVLSSNQKNNWNAGETHELKIEFTTPSDLTGYRLLAYNFFGKNDETSTDAALGKFEITDLMIREANIKEDTFELYKEITETIQLPQNVELCSAGDTRDYIDSKGVIHKKTKKIVLNGTEKWYTYTNYTGEGYCYYLEDNSFPLLQINNQKYKHSICSHFKNVYAVWSNNSGIGTYSDHATVHRKYFISDKATLTEFKAWLAQETPELIYVLTEEDTTQSLADTEKEKLQNLKTFVGTNNITTNAPISFTYNLDANNLLDRIIALENKLKGSEVAE